MGCIAIGLDEVRIRVQEFNHALLLVGNALDVSRERIVRHEGGNAGNFDELGGLSAVFTQRAFAELCNGECCALGIDTDAFCSCHLHGLNLDQLLALEVAGCCSSDSTDQDDGEAEARDRAPHACGFLCAFFTAEALCASHPPHGKTCNEGAGNEPCGGNDVGVFPHKNRVGNDLEEACGSIQFCTPSFGVESCAYGVLHPGVCSEDPQGGDHGSDRCQPHAGKVPALGEASPTEDPQSQEG